MPQPGRHRARVDLLEPLGGGRALPVITFRPAPVSAPVTLTLSEETVSDGEVTLRLSDIVQVRHASRTVRRVRSDYVDLTDGTGARLRIACSGPAGRWGRFNDSTAFIMITAEIAGVLAERRPELTVSLEDSGIWRWGWFILGLITAMLGAGITAFVVHDGLALDRAAGPLFVMGGMALFGAFLAWENRPWRPERTMPVASWRALTQAALQHVTSREKPERRRHG